MGGGGGSAHILHCSIIFDDLSMRKIETERDRDRELHGCTARNAYLRYFHRSQLRIHA